MTIEVTVGMLALATLAFIISVIKYKRKTDDKIGSIEYRISCTYERITAIELDRIQKQDWSHIPVIYTDDIANVYGFNGYQKREVSVNSYCRYCGESFDGKFVTRCTHCGAPTKMISRDGGVRAHPYEVWSSRDR